MSSPGHPPKRRRSHVSHGEPLSHSSCRRDLSISLPPPSLAEVPFQPLYHHPSDCPFPVVMEDAFPAEPYRSRHSDVKSAVHWGQRKLLLSEIQLLAMYGEPGVAYHIVYVGSAPGTHLGFLDDLFAYRHTWELIDPGEFDLAVLAKRPNMILRNEFFTNYTAYDINVRRLTEALPSLGKIYRFLTLESMDSHEKEIHKSLRSALGTLDVARGTEDIPSMYEPLLQLPRGLELLCIVGMEHAKPLLFISDIRSGSLSLPNFEDHVAENMQAQEAWTMILQATYSMLKFRLPYTRKAKSFGGRDVVEETRLIRPDGCVSYLHGDILLPIWTRPTSTEGRLVVKQGAVQKDYNVAHIENQFFFLNARVREQIHFNHFMDSRSYLDHHFDGTAEVMCLKRYLQFMFPQLNDASDEVLRDEVGRVSNSITKHLGVTFKNTIHKRNALLIKQARSNGVSRTSFFKVKSDKAQTVTNSENSVDCAHSEDLKRDIYDAEKEDSSTDRYNNLRDSSKSETAHLMNEWEAFTRRMISLAERERNRLIWRTNIDESKYNQPSGFWVTTEIRMA
ncbi:unnamed protein product [Phytomonas sp. Hart1]|nr:unnamed protein product [Phytomonas sp. Hart1]|eukprot:CCW69508.1 unnamed protein product [Phytomonas sp. isolate Hart1]